MKVPFTSSVESNNNSMERPHSSDDEWLRSEIAPHAPEVRRWLRNRFPSVADVDEIIQDGFVKVVDRQRKSPIDHPKPFLFSVCRNLAIDYLRKHKVVNFESLHDHADSAVLSTDLEGVQNALSDKEHRAIMMLAIDQLPRKCRRIFLLRKVEGLPLKEIAQQLGISTKTVEVQISIGLKKCKKFFATYEKEMGS